MLQDSSSPTENLEADHATVLTALYLRGCPIPAVSVANRSWRFVLRELRVAAASTSDAERTLERAGLWAEATRLACPGIISWAERLVGSGRVLTPASSLYPRRWLKGLQLSSPPALWIAGSLPGGSTFGIAGSRAPTRTSRVFAQDAGEAAARKGLVIISGGASGVDRSAVRGALGCGGVVIEILPCGLSRANCARDGVCRLSACAPGEPFTAAGAMERNALIYSAPSATLVVQPRLREGGSWHGAVSALRRRLCEIRVLHQPGNAACAALESLGAQLVTTVEDALAPAGEEPSLFDHRR